MSYIKENSAESYPTLDSCHLKEYRHSGCIVKQVTVILGIEKNIHILDDESSGASLIEKKLQNFFRKSYSPKTSDPDLFLPPQYTPAGILLAAEHLMEGKESYSEAEKFIKNHTGILILEISDIYFYRPENSWAVQCWILDTDHLDHTSVDYYIRNGLTAESGRPESIKNAAAACPSEKESIIQCDENGLYWDEEDDMLIFGNPGEEMIIERDLFSMED